VYADIMNIMPLPATIAYSFPEYVRMTGEVVRGELVKHRDAGREVSKGRGDVAADTPASRGTLLHNVQQLGVSLYGKRWPVERARVLRDLGLQDRIESSDEAKLATVLRHLKVEAEEREERAAA
jgi:hypothetical protein